MVKPGIVRDRTGAASIALASLAVVMALGGFGVWALLHRWTEAMAMQLKLDRCVGEKAIQMRSQLRILDMTNFHMKALRVAEVGEMVVDGGVGTKAALAAELAAQTVIYVEWQGVRAYWAAHRCGSAGDRVSLLPDIDWQRDPPDELGPQPFVWKNMEHVYIQMRNGARISTAELKQTRGHRGVKDVFINGGALGTDWDAIWAEPR